MEERRHAEFEEVRSLIEARDSAGLAKALRDLASADIADLIDVLPADAGSFLLSSLETQAAGEALAEVSDHPREDVLEELSTEQIAELIEDLPGDDVADILGDVAPEHLGEVLADLDDEDREEVTQLLSYGEDTAGGIMTMEVVTVSSEMTAAAVIAELRSEEEIRDDVFAIYVVDQSGRLSGWLGLARLVTAAPEVLVRDILEESVVSCTVHTDQEQVAFLMARYNLVTIPVVDDEERVVGRVTFDDVIDVIEQETTEDILRMAGSSTKEISERSALRVVGIRLPWVVVGLLGGLASGFVMSRFEAVFVHVLGIIFFLPAVVALGGNVGIQSATVVIRGLTTGDFTVVGAIRPILKEIRVGLAIGVVCGLIAGSCAYAWLGDPAIGWIVGLAMAATATMAAIAGGGLPFLLDRAGIDPAVATGPFITTAVDVLGILLYFSLASWLLQAFAVA